MTSFYRDGLTGLPETAVVACQLAHLRAAPGRYRRGHPL